MAFAARRRCIRYHAVHPPANAAAMLRILLLLIAALVALPAAAAEKTLYQCRAADGSIAFQEEPCDGEPMKVIPIDPQAAGAPLVELTDPTCQALAQLVWRLSGQVDNTDFSPQGRQELEARRATLVAQCGVELGPTVLAGECATLAAAVGLGPGPDTAAYDRLVRQHDTLCSKEAIASDLSRALKRTSPVR
jgi:hypothetical protein